MADDEDNYSWLREELPPVSSFWQVESRTIGDLLNDIFELAVLFARGCSEKDVAANMAQTFANISTSGGLLPIMMASLLGRSGYLKDDQVITFFNVVTELFYAVCAARKGDRYSRAKTVVAKMLVENRFSLKTLEDLVVAPSASYPSSALGHVWKIIRLMGDIAPFVQPISGRNVATSKVRLREEGPSSVETYRQRNPQLYRKVAKLLGQDRSEHQTVRSLAKKIYIEQCSEKGITVSPSTIGDGWKKYNEWVDNIPSEFRQHHPKVIIRNYALSQGPTSTFFVGEGLEIWQDLRRTINQPRRTAKKKTTTKKLPATKSNGKKKLRGQKRI